MALPWVRLPVDAERPGDSAGGAAVKGIVERSHCATARKRKAAKQHRCECGRVISKGEHYVMHTGFPGHDALSITVPIRMAECWRCACRYGRDYLLGADVPPEPTP